MTPLTTEKTTIQVMVVPIKQHSLAGSFQVGQSCCTVLVSTAQLSRLEGARLLLTSKRGIPHQLAEKAGRQAGQRPSSSVLRCTCQRRLPWTGRRSLFTRACAASSATLLTGLLPSCSWASFMCTSPSGASWTGTTTSESRWKAVSWHEQARSASLSTPKKMAQTPNVHLS